MFLRGLVPLFLAFVFHFHSPLQGVEANPFNLRSFNSTTERIADLAQDTSVAGLEETLSLLNNLTNSQKELVEQQRLRQEELRMKNEMDERRERNRTEILEEEHTFFNEMRGKISRKIKAMVRNPNAGVYAPSEHVSAPPNVDRPKDCADHYLNAEETSGIFRVWPAWDRDGKGFLVYCDMNTDEGGWTVIRRWGHNMFSNDFFKKSWKDYKVGFGDMKRDFWLGNEQVYALTNQNSYELRFDIQMLNENGYETSTYNRFWIDNESERYRAHVVDIKLQEAGDLFGSYNGAKFTTSDVSSIEITTTTTQRPMYGYSSSRSNQDNYRPECAFGWWYKYDCTISDKLKPWRASVPTQNEMKIRPVDFIKTKQALSE